jgi:hypothetical protein
MLATFERRRAIISILLIFALLACLLFRPGVSRPLGLVVVLISVGMAITFTVQKHIRAWQKGQIDRPTMIRNIVVEVLGVLITITAVLLVAGKVAQVVGMAAGGAIESQWPGAGMPLGILSGLLAGILVGIGIGLLVQLTWGRLVKRPAVPRENGV